MAQPISSHPHMSRSELRLPSCACNSNTLIARKDLPILPGATTPKLPPAASLSQSQPQPGGRQDEARDRRTRDTVCCVSLSIGYRIISATGQSHPADGRIGGCNVSSFQMRQLLCLADSAQRAPCGLCSRRITQPHEDARCRCHDQPGRVAKEEAGSSICIFRRASGPRTCNRDAAQLDHTCPTKHRRQRTQHHGRPSNLPSICSCCRRWLFSSVLTRYLSISPVRVS